MGTSSGEAGAGVSAAGGLNADTIAAAEFAYIAEAVFKTSEDGAKASNYYIVTLAGIFAAIIGLDSESAARFGITTQDLSTVFAVLFFLLAFYSLFTLSRLIRLRAAWVDSVKAMNNIKEKYKTKFPAELEGVFTWKTDEHLKRFKFGSVSFISAFEVSAVAGLSLGAAIMFLMRSMLTWGWLPAFVAGGVFSLMLLASYCLTLYQLDKEDAGRVNKLPRARS